jgi:hypothetical protein
VLFENGWTSTQSCGVVGLGEGDGLGDGVGLGDGLLLGVGLGVAVGLSLAGEVAPGLGLADGVGLAGALALGDGLALGLALAAWLGVAEAELSGTSARPTASARVAGCAFLDLLVVTAGRWAHVLVALSRLAREMCRLAREVCATAAPPAPLPTRSNPAMTLKVAVWVRPIAVVIETPSPRCRPQRGRRTALPYLIAVRMSGLAHSLLAPFDTSCGGRDHRPRESCTQTLHRTTSRPQIAFWVLFSERRRRTRAFQPARRSAAAVVRQPR